METNNFNELLSKAEQSIKTADHMVYITYPLLKEKLLLKKILEELYNSASSIVQAILNYEALYKRITLQDKKTNLFLFKEKCAPRFNIIQTEIQTLLELLSLGEKYEASTMDFIRKDKLVIMNDDLRTESVDLNQLKKYLSSLKILLLKVRDKIKEEKSTVKA